MLARIITELLKEIGETCDKLTLLERWRGVKKQYEELKTSLHTIAARVRNSKLQAHEIPILQTISNQIRLKKQTEVSAKTTIKGSASAKATIDSAELRAEVTGLLDEFDKTLDDSDVYNEYSDVILKSFPFSDIIAEIQTIITEAGLARLVVFFDDFSELKLVDQRLFVDVVLSPLNNSSNEAVKLKIAGYPGRVYYGKIDPGKVDTISLDFCDLYEATEVQEMERSASDYAARLLTKRFSVFGVQIQDFFDFTSEQSKDELMRLMFQASFNVPRIMGHLLHILYLDRVSRGQKITSASIRLASRKYYENTISKYFDRMNRYALEPFQNKLDRHNQKELLKCLVMEATTVRRKITNREVGGNYFVALQGIPPTSHFTVHPELEEVFSSLESNFFVSRYKKLRDKEGRDVIAYALFLGLCESERMTWGYPDGRPFRHYFQQRCFEYTRAVHLFLSRNKTIKCGSCGCCHPMELKESLALYKWRCPECNEGVCAVTNLSDDFEEEIDALDKGIMLEPIELEIVSILHEENRRMRAGEISALIDTTHQLVGRRTSKLQEMGLISKERDERDGRMKSVITERCEITYFE